MYKTHAEFFVRMLIKLDPLSNSQSELRSSFKPLLSTTGILQFGLRSCSGNNFQPSKTPVVPMESNHLHMDSLFKAFMHSVLALMVGVGLSITLLAQTSSLVACNPARGRVERCHINTVNILQSTVEYSAADPETSEKGSKLHEIYT